MPKIVCISDTHRQEKNLILPKGDILIHTGDFDIYGIAHLEALNDWFGTLNFRDIIFIGGNHDLLFPYYHKDVTKSLFTNAIYLENDSVEIDGIKIWGSPYSPFFSQGWAFNGFVDDLKKIWSTIPSDTDIVITHCNPFGINDVVRGISQGCPALRDRLKEIKPKYHISGHIHEGYGIYQDENTVYVNASIMDEFYTPINKPIVIEYE